MADRISFSSEVLTIEKVARTHSDTDKSLRFYYTAAGLEHRDSKFIGYSQSEVQAELSERLRELDTNSALGVLTALEASFRIDYLNRCYQRRKDDLSRHFRNLHKTYANRVPLEQTILEGWKMHVGSAKSLVSDIIGAFKYRHWLAHGRYWLPKLGQDYDFFSVFNLAQQMESLFEAEDS